MTEGDMGEVRPERIPDNGPLLITAAQLGNNRIYTQELARPERTPNKRTVTRTTPTSFGVARSYRPSGVSQVQRKVPRRSERALPLSIYNFWGQQ